MKKQIYSGLGLALIAILVLAIPASAAQPTAVSGKLAWAGPPSNLVMRPAGSNCFIDVDVPYVFYDGALDGFSETHFRIVSHGECPADPFQNNENLKASGTFVGTVDGHEGTFDFNYEAKAWPAEVGELALVGRIVILSGTGDLANLHGVLEMAYIMGEEFDTYTGQIHFDP